MTNKQRVSVALEYMRGEEVTLEGIRNKLTHKFYEKEYTYDL